MMSLDELAALIPGAVLAGDGRVRFGSVSTDTRTITPGALYFALKGERFDAHDFAAQAASLGAVALVVERPVEAGVPQVIVPDTRLALGQAAAGWRARFRLPLIAVTGSNGKTTVTQMIAAILAAAYGATGRLTTRGNLNNDIGLPLMMFGLNEGHQAAVLELGMNHPGEIEYLARLARPTVTLVNNAQREHQEFMATVEATAEENGSAIAALPPDGTAVFPADDGCAGIWRTLAGERRVLDFALRGPAAVTATFHPQQEGTALTIATLSGPLDILLPLTGSHNVHNALAAVTSALAIGIAPEAIRAGLEGFTPVSGRGMQGRAASGARVIDDTYNANPDSVRAAIDLLAEFPAPRVLVLGDMGEVGTEGPAFHREVGQYARVRGIEILLGLGELCAEAVAAFNEAGTGGARHFESIEALIAAAREAAVPAATLLAKGSRFMRMERVVRALTGQE
jgi:UDP-N-acetylmuramoyl-tripeptide--D-alanyl-D-alanine ligase